jgi:hypothetical protein
VGNREAAQRGSVAVVWQRGVQRRERVSAMVGDECGRTADLDHGV